MNHEIEMKSDKKSYIHISMMWKTNLILNFHIRSRGVNDFLIFSPFIIFGYIEINLQGLKGSSFDDNLWNV